MNTFSQSSLQSFTSEGESRFETSPLAAGTRSAREVKVVSPWVQSTREIMALPFYEGQGCPSRKTRVLACQMVEMTFHLSQQFHLDWEAPLVNSNDQNEIVLEWWKGQRKITLYVGESHSTYVRVWGKDIWNEMDEGEFGKHFDSPLTLLWLWLHS